MQITNYGHSCFGVEIGGKSILFDPFISGNPLAAEIKIDEIKADYILISHGHADHVADVEVILKNNPDAQLVSNYEIIQWYGTKGIENGVPMNFGGKVQLDFGTVKYVVAQHSSVLPDGTYGGNPGGFVVSSEEGKFYFAGDTALTYDMKLIGEYDEPDFAILPIGDCFTMGVGDAIIAAEFVQCNTVIGCHYNTFPPITIDLEDAYNKFQEAGIELVLMEIGETKEM